MGLRVAGSIEVKTDGSILEAKGQWSYNLGHPTLRAKSKTAKNWMWLQSFR